LCRYRMNYSLVIDLTQVMVMHGLNIKTGEKFSPAQEQ
jgi:hypothetical protein